MRRARPLTRGLAALTVALLALLSPLAYASPPDPSWIAGVFDGSDFDDVVHLVLTCSGVAAVTVARAHPPVHVRGAAAPGVAVAAPAAPGSSSLSRAPPIPLASSV